jgi:hypothetical protein
MKNKAMSGLGILVFILLAGSVSAWWDDSYQYRIQLNVTNTKPETLITGYPVSVTFNHTALIEAGKSQADGDDIRIVWQNGSAWVELDRRVENQTTDPALGDAGWKGWNLSSTIVWFEIQENISASSTDNNYYVYYGKPSAANPPVNFYRGDYGFIGTGAKADPAIQEWMAHKLWNVSVYGCTDETWEPNNYDVVFFSETCASGACTWLRPKTTGIYTSEQSMSGTSKLGIGVGTKTGLTQVTISNNSHYVTKGYSLGENITVHTSSQWGWFTTANDCYGLLYARGQASGNMPLVLCEKNTMLEDSTAAVDRRAGDILGSEQDWINFYTMDAWNLFDRLTEWTAHQDKETAVAMNSEEIAPQPSGPAVIITWILPEDDEEIYRQQSQAGQTQKTRNPVTFVKNTIGNIYSMVFG